MTPDWRRVTLEDVRLACEMYDSGAARPNRTARTTFLVVNDKTYPAKFIRGLAYRLATGVELDPNVDYSGGLETVRFFRSLGLATQHGSDSIPAVSGLTVEAPPPAHAEPVSPQDQPPSSAPRRLPETQKEALSALLRRRFGAVEREAKFPWLLVPAPEQMDGAVLDVYQALQGLRGFSAFASFGKQLLCDFFIPAENLLIEYDERQHFSAQRAKSLELYPQDLALGFDRQEWLTACRTTQAADSAPPYRDEQRAFYDSLRDILAARNGTRLIRLRYGTFDWTGPGADAQLSAVLENGQSSVQRPAPEPSAQLTANAAADRIRKVALVSHNYNVANDWGLYDYSEHFARINQLCDEQGCDTILYALYTWDRKSRAVRDHDTIFGGLDNVQRVLLEVCNPAPERVDHNELWLRGKPEPIVAHQHFAKSSDPDDCKLTFMRELPARRVADGLLVLCGETNIGSTHRSSDRFSDPHGFSDTLDQMNIDLILNPIHDYMRRYEMKKKRLHYSLNGRTVISVWNQGKGSEAPVPWTVFHDGVERTTAVRKLPRPFSDRRDIRIGVLDLESL